MEEYRNFVYGGRKSQHSISVEQKHHLGTKKSASFTKFTTSSYNSSSSIQDKEDAPKPQIRYVRSKDNLKSVHSYNKSSDLRNSETSKKEEGVGSGKKEPIRDITRMTYISKNVYSPKYADIRQSTGS